jgi:hypothetical protein
MAASTPPLRCGTLAIQPISTPSRAHQHQVAEMPDMGDPERLPLLVGAGRQSKLSSTT